MYHYFGTSIASVLPINCSNIDSSCFILIVFKTGDKVPLCVLVTGGPLCVLVTGGPVCGLVTGGPVCGLVTEGPVCGLVAEGVSPVCVLALGPVYETLFDLVTCDDVLSSNQSN